MPSVNPSSVKNTAQKSAKTASQKRGKKGLKNVGKGVDKGKPQGRPELVADENPMGLPDMDGMIITKRGYRKIPRNAPREKLANAASYKEYLQLNSRPEDMEPWAQDENGAYIVQMGELFCRFPHAMGGLCLHNHKFSSTGNLKHHVKKAPHKVKTSWVQGGCKKYADIHTAEKWYDGVMEKHSRIVEERKAEMAAKQEAEKAKKVAAAAKKATKNAPEAAIAAGEDAESEDEDEDEGEEDEEVEVEVPDQDKLPKEACAVIENVACFPKE